jgi:diguanylate cyclase (GGDEF)-like protein
MFYIYFPYGTDGVLLFLVPLAAFGLALELYARSTNISRRLSVVQEISRKVSTILDPDRLAGEALESIAEIVSYQWGGVWLRDARTGNLKAPYCISAVGEDRPVPQSPPRAALRAAQEGRPIDFTARSGAVSGFTDELPWQHMLALPIASRGEVYGVLGLSSPSMKGFSSQDRRLLDTLADNVAIAVQNAMLYQQREREAIRDGLTRLYNHRFLQEKLVLEIERFKRYGRPFSLIMIDIDHFKKYNDAFGHPEGDSLLVILAGFLKESVRQVDFVARYGGEEFAIVLPECNREEALVVAERVRSRIEACQNPHRERYNLTISAGVSTFPTDGDSKEALLDQADQALYRAKEEGRNRVCV